MKKKLLITILLILIVVSIFITKSYGFGIDDLDGGIKINSSDDLVNLGNSAFSIITTFGVIVSVVILIVLGIKYMLGSVEKKAEYKKSMIPYLVGAALLFGASTISGIIYKLAIKL